MNRTFRFSYLKIAVLALAMSFGLSAYAGTAREDLAHAYRLLKTANADYKGHKAKAMTEIEIAGKNLGLELGGVLEVREKQWKSDEQLREARRLLTDLRVKLEEKDRVRVAERVDKAIKEIDTALEIK